MKTTHEHTFQRSKNGFTLLEILAVVAIIGLLAGIVAHNVRKHMIDTKDKQTLINAKRLKTAVVDFELRLSRLPASLDELTFEGDEDWPGPFIDDETVPKDAWGNDFRLIKKGKRIKIQSAGPDGIYDNGDDILV